MHRQMRTHEVHYTTENYEVETQTGIENGERIYEIVVVERESGIVTSRDVESVEKAIKLCDRRQDYIEKKYAERAAELKAAREAAAKEKAERKAAEARGPLATSRQVDYIMALLAQHDGQNVTWFSQGPTTLAEVKRMTRRDASTYISALKGE